MTDYGSLTHQKMSNMVTDESEMEPDKRGPHDFALWKAPKPGEPEDAAWESPWGRGRPGWHIECSAMSGRYLGDSFDIHGGGIDLRFPHHENEQAQSHAAGREFARYWMHNAWVTIEGEKMSKSLGNSLTVRNIVKDIPPVVLRLALGTVQYRSTVAYSPETLTEAAAVWDRLAGFVERSVAAVGEVPAQEIADPQPRRPARSLRRRPGRRSQRLRRLAVIHETVTQGNNALADRDDPATGEAQRQVRAMLDVLGLDPLAEPWRSTGSSDKTHEALDSLVSGPRGPHGQARARKDWARADALRDSLTAAGIAVEDSAEGAHWHLEER